MHSDSADAPPAATALHNLHDFFLAVNRAPEFLEQLKAAERHSMTDRRKTPIRRASTCSARGHSRYTSGNLATSEGG